MEVQRQGHLLFCNKKCYNKQIHRTQKNAPVISTVSFPKKKMDKYLATSAIIDWKSYSVIKQAKDLSKGLVNKQDIAKVCFEYVRDEVKHSNDYKLNPVTCKASDVLKYKTGYCYAKSHLLAALLRANGIPAGLCYQRLTIENDKPLFCLHGLNAVYLQEIGWYRIDARGNKEGMNAEFTPPIEKLAFPIIVEGESDIKEIFSAPLPEVVKTLTTCKNFQEVAENLPDIQYGKS